MSADAPTVAKGQSIKNRKALVAMQLRERLFDHFCSSSEGVFAAVVTHIKAAVDSTAIEDMESILRPNNEELLHEMARAAVQAFNKPKEESEDDSGSEGEGAQEGGERRSPRHWCYRIRTSGRR